MNRILLFLLSAFFASPMVGQFWQTDFEKARLSAADEGKPLVLVFQGSDWCAPCIRLDREVWGTDEFRQYAASRWIMVQADFPRRAKNALPPERAKANAELAERYNKNGVFPLVVVMDRNGRLLGETSYQKIGPGGYIALIESYLKER